MPTSYSEEERIYHKGFRDGWTAALEVDRSIDRTGLRKEFPTVESLKVKKKTRKASAYSKRYGAAFKRIAPKYKNKRGGWKKDGFKRAQKAAHKEARR